MKTEETLKITGLEKVKTGYGHWRVTAVINYDYDHTLSCVTTNSIAIDNAWDEDCEDHREHEESLINEILRKNDIEHMDYEILF